MLDIFILSSSNLSVLSSINQERASQERLIASSEADSFTLDPSLRQTHGIQNLDEDVDLDLSDDELELIANHINGCEGHDSQMCSFNSDVFVGGNRIIRFSSIEQFVERPERHQELIDYIRREFQERDISVDREEVYGVIAENLRATAPIDQKRQRDGFKVALTGRHAGQLCFFDTACPF